MNISKSATIISEVNCLINSTPTNAISALTHHTNQLYKNNAGNYKAIAYLVGNVKLKTFTYEENPEAAYKNYFHFCESVNVKPASYNSYLEFCKTNIYL